MHSCLLALNLGESAGDALDPVEMVRIYVAYALELQRQRTIISDGLASFYLWKGKAVASRCQGRAAMYAWVFQADGLAYFKSDAWTSQQLQLADGSVLHPGSYEHLSLSFRRHLLRGVLHDLVADGPSQTIQLHAQELLQHCIVSSVRRRKSRGFLSSFREGCWVLRLPHSIQCV